MNKLFRVLLIFIILTGCARQRIIDDLALINALGYDLEDEDKQLMKVTTTFPIITKNGEYDQETLVVTGKSSKSARQNLKNKTNLQLESGQLRVAVYGAELARKGLTPIIDTLVRDPNIGIRVMMMLGRNDANEILSLSIKNEGQNPNYLEQFIKKIQQDSHTAKFNIFQFNRDLYEDGIDPSLPVFKVVKKNIVFDGIGLFRDDKLVDFISAKEARLLSMLDKEIHRGELDIEIELEEGKKDMIMIAYKQKKHSISITPIPGEGLRATIDIKLVGDIHEYTGEAELSDPAIQKKVEKKINQLLDKQGAELVAKLQELQVDPIGVSRYVRNSMKYPEWKKMDWRETFKTIDIKVNTHLEIDSSGKSR